MTLGKTPVTAPVENGRVSETVIRTVADVTDVDPFEIAPLYDIIDPDALDRLFQPTPSASRDVDSRVCFTMAGCQVTVTDNRVVTVTPLSQVEV